MNRLTVILFAMAFQVMALSSLAAEFAISPMMIEIDSAPGSTQEFSFQVHGKKAGIARIFLSGMQQEASGHMAFSSLPPSGNRAEIVKWIKLEKNRVRVKQGETVTINGKLTIPRRISGSHEIAIMVEEDKDKSASGISLNVRYAIILSVHIDGRKTRIKTKYENLQVEEQGGQRFISAWFTNLSDRDAMLDSMVQVRNGQRRLLGRVPLKTKSAWKRDDQFSRVFPGARVKVYGLLNNELPAGDYLLIAKNRFSGKMQPSVNKKIQLAELPSTANKKALKESLVDSKKIVVNNPIAMKVNRKGQAFAVIRLNNPSEKSVRIELPMGNKNPEATFRFTPQVVELNGSASTLVTLRQTFNDGEVKAGRFLARLTSGEEVREFFIETTL